LAKGRNDDDSDGGNACRFQAENWLYTFVLGTKEEQFRDGDH